MSKILDAAHEIAVGLHRIGAITDAEMRQYDAECLPKKRRFEAAEVQRIRASAYLSLSAFARVIGVGPATVEQWEQGLKRPTGASARLLDIIDRKGIDAVL